MHFGERLRQQRIARGLDLSCISEQTRISKRYLEALEKGDWKHLPGSIFARSFARQYSEAVGLEPESIEAEVAAVFVAEDNLPIVEEKPSRSSLRGISLRVLESQFWDRLPKSAISLMAALALCSVLYMGWQRLILGPGKQADAAKALATGIPATKLPLDAATGAAVSQTASAQTGVVPAGYSQSQTAAPAQTTQIDLRAPGNGGSGMAVRIVASQETWVSITANQKKLYQGILQPNEARVIAGVEKAQIVVGNAGGVEVSTDGRSIGPIGPAGQVRVVMLSPNGPQIMRTSQLQPKQDDPQTAAEEPSSKT